MRDAHAGHFHYAGTLRHHVLDFVGINVKAGYKDHILLTIHDLEVAIGTAYADVSRLEPAAAFVLKKRLGRLFGAVVVARHHLRSLGADFAGLVVGGPLAFLVQDSDLGAWPGNPDGTDAVFTHQRVGCQHGRSFGQTVALGGQASRFLVPALGDHFLQSHSASGGNFQLAEIHFAKARVIE